MPGIKLDLVQVQEQLLQVMLTQAAVAEEKEQEMLGHLVELVAQA